MAKLIIKLENDVLDHLELRQGDMKIGRKSSCDVHLDKLAVSGEHANIFTIGEDSFVQDLNSTNGTFINNRRITKHHLRNGDAVQIGKYSLVYMSDAATSIEDSPDFAKTVIISPGSMAPPPAAAVAPAAARAPEPVVEVQATLVILGGVNSGKRIEINKAVTNLGHAGKRAGTISRTAQGLVIAPVDEGEEAPKLNGRAVTRDGQALKNGDVIDVAGTRLQVLMR